MRTLLVILTLGALLTAPDVEAAKAAKCDALQRRAKAKLERGLAKCGRRTLEAEIGTCTTAKWSQYTSRLSRRGCKVAGARLVKIRAAEATADDLALLDAEAREAQLAFLNVLRSLERQVAKAARAGNEQALVAIATRLEEAFARWDEAETMLATLEDVVWNGFVGDVRLPWLIDEPMRVAMETVQIELRRLLGPEWHTEIASVRVQGPCQGDLVGDRMIATYGRAVLEGGSDAAVAALGRIASELACESVRQATLTDVALSTAYDAVELRLQNAGLGRLRDDFARLFAPIEVLTLDAVKLAGDHAYAWHWFVDRHARLRDAVERLGWATDDVLWLYDRIDGQLVGFPRCTGDGDFGRCVDVPAFLDSLVDPRALGLGDCALSGMVAAGRVAVGDASLYACPSIDCGGEDTASAPPSKGAIGGSLGGLFDRFRSSGPRSAGDGQLPWASLSSGDLDAMEEVSCRSGGGAGGDGQSGGSQGPGGSLADWGGTQECIESALHAPRDPYAAYTRCVADAAGRSDGIGGTLVVDLHGSPMGAGCRPGVKGESSSSTPGSGSGSTTTAPANQSTTTTVASTESTTTSAPSANPPCIPSSVLDAIGKLLDCGLPVLEKALKGTTPKPSGAGAVIGPMIELAKPENAQNFYNTGGAVLQNRIDQNCAAGSLSEKQCEKLAGMKPGEQAEYLRAIGKLKDCADPDECESECTTPAGQAMERMDECQQALTDELTPDRPDPDDLVTTPSPDADTGGLPDDPLAQCLLASAGGGDGGGIDLECALVSCADRASTARAGGACCGSSASPRIGVAVGQLLLERTCQTIQCADGEMTVADDLGACGCDSAPQDTSGITPSPKPSPEGFGRGVDTLP